MKSGRNPRQPRRYELISCALGGHVLVGTDVAEIRPQDAALVREADGLRWHRCLRCDVWLPQAAPDEPERTTIPERREITLPDRGPALRDKYILRIIAVERTLHVVVFGAAAVLLVLFGEHHATFRRDYDDIMTDLSGTDPATTQARGLVGHLRSLVSLSPKYVYGLAAVAALLAVLEAIEAVGLWRGRRWAEYLTFVATTLFLPWEIYELSESITTFRVIALVINLAVVAYLLVAKRLFGLRGGGRADERRRREGGGWGAIDRASPAAVNVASGGRSTGSRPSQPGPREPRPQEPHDQEEPISPTP